MILKLKRTPGIYLVGFMGCGKTTVGRALADELGWFFFDLDQEIERREGATIADIFDTRGEPEFRRMENAALQERVRNVQSGRPQVISLGGGTFLSEENFDLVSNHGVSIWIDCPLARIEQRIAGHVHRPLARDPERLRTLFEARRDGYARAHFRIEVAGDDPAAAVARILALPLF
jgi:shikimate kinase